MIKQTKLAQVLEVLEENPHLIEIVQGWAQVVYPHLATPPAQPPQRTWVGLTDKVITKVVDSMPRGIKGWMSDWDLYDYARAIEAKLKENT